MFTVDSAANNLGELIRSNNASRQATRNRNSHATTANSQQRQREDVHCQMSSLSKDLAEFENRNSKIVGCRIACKYPQVALIGALHESQVIAEGAGRL